MSPTVVPILETPRLCLDAITPDDLGRVFELFSSDRAMAYYDLEPLTDREQAREFIESWQARVDAGKVLRREAGYWKGGYHDLECFGLLAAEFRR